MKNYVCGVSWTRPNYLVCNVAQRKFPILLLPLSLICNSQSAFPICLTLHYIGAYDLKSL